MPQNVVRLVALFSLRRTDEPQKGRNSCLRLRPRSGFGSFGVVLMSCKVNFHLVRSALQNSVCLSCCGLTNFYV